MVEWEGAWHCPNADTLEFWAGLTADVKESAGRTQSGNIIKAGSVMLRWALCQAALTLCQCDAKQDHATATDHAHRQAEGQRGHGPAAAADPLRHGSRRKAVRRWSAARPRHRGQQGETREKTNPTGRLTTEKRGALPFLGAELPDTWMNPDAETSGTIHPTSFHHGLAPRNGRATKGQYTSRGLNLRV